ncbi:MAG: DUF2249 domain-containing protein [Motiliproteus sp.]
MGTQGSSHSLTAIQLDVSAMEPPEPMLAIFSALAELPRLHRLDVHHRRQPFPLYGMLQQTGYQYRCQPLQQGYLIQIWPGENADRESLAKLVQQAPDCGVSS